MAYEIINHPSNTPPRLYALVRLVAANPGIEQKTILTLLQPPPINKNTLAAEDILEAAIKIDLIKGDVRKCYEANIPLKEIASYSKFRELMQQKLLGVVDEENDQFLLNMFTAWFAVKNAEYLKSPELKQMAAEFNDTLHRGAESRALNDTKLGGTDDWMAFLGFGWKMDNYFLMPDATLRIKPFLNELLPSTEKIPFAKFMTKLAKLCPELDCGVLFKRCWQAAYGSKPYSNELSLMLSTALRNLHKQKKIQLIYLRDSRDNWKLYPDLSDSFSSVTQVCGTKGVA